MRDEPGTFEAMAAAVRAFAAVNWPGMVPDQLTLRLYVGGVPSEKTLALPSVDLCGAAAAPVLPFVPTSFQASILDALEGKALRTDALGAAVGDRGRLYKANGLKELQEHGLVAHHPRLGYYSVSAPPEDLQQ